jgi:pyruvate kinase
MILLALLKKFNTLFIVYMRKTKIICTIGPKTSTIEALEELAKGGMNVARLNFSHGTYEWHGAVMDKVKELNATGKYNIALMLDTKGPEIRTGDVKQPMVLEKGTLVVLTTRKEAEYPEFTTEINYDQFINDVEVGDQLLIDSGLINLKIVEKTATDVISEVLDGGTMGSRRHVNILGKSANLPAITEKDWQDIDFGISKNIDFIALSFVNGPDVVNKLNKYLKEKNSTIKIISKIESVDAVKNMDQIIDASDAIMIARGDLGAELPVEEVPMIQGKIVKQCRKTGKPVIVATQLLESMMVNPTPTRAEVTDIFYAVNGRADAIMMSGETANGNYPFKSLETMQKVALQTELRFMEDAHILVQSSSIPKNEIALGASVIANNIKAKAMLVFTETGETSSLVSQCRPNSPIYSFTYSESIKLQLCLNWGTESYLVEKYQNPEKNVQEAIKILKENGNINSGDTVIVVSNILVDAGFVHTVQVRYIA